ncbi:class I SAM-dependent methyltransferase [Chitinophaga sp. G-6-1-13]|uniref:Class I SAM-dependent methyltransferase n=1 Tax=Chitinophaga fulva TaxID=2728842 RepID=A0A848GX78_9BACT|nr:class I SAM-dependent methyltransferase [Chitinophaga fulva]NML40258.1 class I SAM-dependent methyltransferase [Chitinophaga fulva]
MTDQLYHDQHLAQFYDLDNSWGKDFDQYLRWAATAHSILDIGCGTGVLCTRMADTYPEKQVTGLDVAPAMLHIAQARPGGDKVNWLLADGRSFAAGQSFDMILLGGHAFQTFLSQEDRIAMLRHTASCLTKEGRLFFDSRNPAAQDWLTWGPADSLRELQHPQLGKTTAWNDYQWENGIVTYGTYYRVAATGIQYAASSDIAFPELKTIEEALDQAGLETVQLWGSWDMTAYTPQSEEMIFEVRHKTNL